MPKYIHQTYITLASTQLETLADNMYHFVHEEVSKRSKRSALSILQRLHGDTNVCHQCISAYVLYNVFIVTLLHMCRTSNSIVG